MTELDMLTNREQLMEDIDCIISEFFGETWGHDEYTDTQNDLTKTLCDAVCKNFSLEVN